MSETRWSFYEPTSGTNLVGLYHGIQSGHVIVYLNSRVMLIDFLIKESKTYSLYVNDYLIEIRLDKDDKAFEYTMNVTPPPSEVSPFDKCVTYVSEWFRDTFA